MWKFKIVNKISSDLKSEHVFFQPELIDAWIKTYKPIRNLRPIFIQAENGRIKMLLPLLSWKRNWKNLKMVDIIPVGYSDFDYHSPFYSGKPTDAELVSFWDELIGFIKSNISFDRIRIDGIPDSMIGSNDKFSSQYWLKGEICPKLHLDDLNSEEDLWKFLKTSLRGDIRRQIRRLSEIGELKMMEYTSWDEIPYSVFNEFMIQHSQRWPNAYKAPHFHVNLLKKGLKDGKVHFSVLMAGEKAVAWHLGFEHEGCYYYYMPAGNKGFSKHSPTKVHLFFLIKRAIERGDKVFDHLRGDETYKSGWSNSHEFVNNLMIENNSLRTKIKIALLHTLKSLPLRFH